MTTSTVLSKSKFNVYGAITEKIVRAMKDAKGTYQMPWHSVGKAIEFPTNAVTENAYRGVNILALWVDAIIRNYPTGHWASYKQWQSIGAQVRYQERGSIIIFYKKLDQTELERAAGELPRSVGRASWVFNAAQVDNWKPPEPKELSAVAIEANVNAFVEATEARVVYGYPMAQYRTDLDCIQMPNPAWFFDTKTQTASEGFHSTLFHELTHWTGSPRRLERFAEKRVNVRADAFEELVAELGAAFLCAAFKIMNEPRQDHAAYLAEWIQVLDNNPKALFAAAGKAQEAVEYLVQLAAEKLGPFTEVA